jgi:DNA (cytosine-5)-methyltransferase 1
MNSKLRAIDLYSGIGGWTLGFKLAGVEMAGSFEYWPPAIRTHEANFDSPVIEQDIRNLKLTTLPKKIDFVVGSPPCTQFSYSNRGGNGDIEDGLKDIMCFLRVVKKLKPKFWAMENVPRVKTILEKALAKNPKFKKFAGLFNYIGVVNCSEFGLPQARKRMIAGNFPHELLEEYKEQTTTATMGDVLSALQQPKTNDFIYGYSEKTALISGLENEPYLKQEESRMNREAKGYHPVYNKMSFPDSPDRPARTITSTCTRVSRESIIIKPKGKKRYRRLNLRERASLQGFPITFDFYGKSYSHRLKQVGNAVPPVLSYYIAHAMLGTSSRKIKTINQLRYVHPLSEGRPKKVSVKTTRSRYPSKRSFRAAIPGLRFGSGMRFDFSNVFDEEKVYWQVKFYFGPSKDFQIIHLNGQFQRLAQNRALLDKDSYSDIKGCLKNQGYLKGRVDASSLQNAWNWEHRLDTNPHTVIDALGATSDELMTILLDHNIQDTASSAISHLIGKAGNGRIENLPSGKKLRENAVKIFSGIILGSYFNSASLLAKPKKVD